MSKYYPRGTPKVAYVRVVPSLHPTICRPTYDGPPTYVLYYKQERTSSKLGIHVV
jgi:hypothetical protein